ncbi:PTS lactose/cellobiose transporter subunit IIA [Fictibacillus barbaricus]|uniref:PTS lactose/cellobiose transporter subunit IIA n=1 Tax=Fictibacillus barbaricus TaxID=182136 RepID=A0ABS2ZGV4_9BACL|nr:PTS lactose/cellobiose transporter subunit IIA [Fictibacillus barbaricus]MBN3546897.1 PTS lactose/cellobiose transporter subunit IIA [Fictibacillus barbaricus]GGB44689.1 PTS cellobiose transporter subunit IIA [Fictibacillus barbaricus]
MKTIEQTIFSLILHSGDAKSSCMEAIMYAKAGDFTTAEELIEKAGLELNKAHKIQTALIQDETRGESTDIAQDHLMNAMTARDFSKEIIDLHKRLADRLEGRE